MTVWENLKESKVSGVNITNKHLVYEFWVSDCDKETEDKRKEKKLKCYTNHPFSPFICLDWLEISFL